MRRHRAAAALNAVTFVLVFLVAGAFAAGKPDLKTYPASDFKDSAYMQKVHQKVGASWKIPDERPNPPAKSVVIVTILRDGSVIESRLHMKSGSDAWDASATDAVKKAAPFDPLPKSYPRTSVEVHFHFEMD
ncbi:MAG TPA: energy transducer TonB [Candidatus Polarisedimenticolia bacterium]|jgi:protein TonB